MGVSHSGSWSSNPNQVKDVFFSHFESFFQKGSKDIIFSLGRLKVHVLSNAESQKSDSVFSLQEIELALKQIDPGKAPGPDGMNFRILKQYWDLMKADVLGLFYNFYESNSLPKGCNSSFIVLIPKCSQPCLVGDYRPISLINCSIKFLMKVLANRMKPVLTSIIDETQSAFVKGRHISDSVLIVKEMVHGPQLGKFQGLIFKIDFEKAFDSINWNFLFDCLRSMNLGSK